ncbi:MAG TPA: hypothetical protein VD973_06420 [Symbiobacteriaceae bacterium]|nr:hypothetical protein [Symbiobacteriaceae bacterium]
MSDTAAFYDQVLSRVIRFVEYDGYGGKPRNAAKAIRKKFPHMSLAECAAAFQKVLAVYEEAAALICSNEDACWDVFTRTGRKVLIPDSLRLELAQNHPDVPESTTSGALSWIFYWHHLR